MVDIKLEVTIYAGYRGSERPKSFLFEGNTVDVAGIRHMWVEEEHRTRLQKRFFEVTGSDAYEYTLYHELESGEWFLRKREKKADPDRTP